MMESHRLLEDQEGQRHDRRGSSSASEGSGRNRASARAPFGTPCQLLTSSSEEGEDDCHPSGGGGRLHCDYEDAVERAGFGRFHYLHLFVCGWANAADAIEILCISFLLPTASCELGLTSADKVENAMNDQFSDIQIGLVHPLCYWNIRILQSTKSPKVLDPTECLGEENLTLH